MIKSSLLELAATRAAVSAEIELTRQIVNGLASPCRDFDIHGSDIASAALGSLVGDGIGAGTAEDIGEHGATALGSLSGGVMSLPGAISEGADRGGP